MNEKRPGPGLVSTGISGLDDILLGGLPAYRQYLVEGSPGTGKTTLSLQFLMEGRRLGEKCLYIALSESSEEIVEVSRSHGWTLDDIELYELEGAKASLRREDEYTVFRPEEVELSETIQEVFALMERTQPARVVFDSLSELRLLARDPLRYRRQILGLKRFFAGKKCTLLLLDDRVMADPDLQLQSISHGVLSLERLGQEYGVSRRRLNVVKLRGAKFRDGYHDYTIDTGGLRVFPRLVASEHRTERRGSVLASGIPGMDALLGGGLSAGTSTLMIGPAGTGKSTLAGAFVRAASLQGQHAAVYIFEETRQIYLERMAGVGLSFEEALASGRMLLQQVDPAELSPGQFVQGIRDEVEQRNCHVVVIDSLNGYMNAMPNERFLVSQMHELLSYLAEKGVITILVAAQHGLIGSVQSPIEVSYLADTVVMLRYFEVEGAIRKAVSALKHRKASHEQTIRELLITPQGVHVGNVLKNFLGVLSGTPIFLGNTIELRKEAE